jgi:hypothetical protein
MLRKIVLAVIVAIVVTLCCIFLGDVLVTLKVDIAVTVGQFLKAWGGVIGVLAGLWYFFAGLSWPGGVA